VKRVWTVEGRTGKSGGKDDEWEGKMGI